jgi:flavin reductase (DIM6/NTAB) family NADH-FMN oxidoreductase RutF
VTGTALDVSPAALRAAAGHFATGVTVVTAMDPAGGAYATTANAVASVSLRPPLVLVCLREESETLRAARADGRFAINVLRHDQRALAEGFARPTGADTWRGVAAEPGAVTGAPLLDGALATLECVVHDVADGGDHRVLVGRVVAVEHPDEHADPLLFYRGAFRTLDEQPQVSLPSRFGDLSLVAVDTGDPRDVSVVALIGEPRRTDGALVYVHAGCVLGDALGHLGCRRRTALYAALETMRAEGRGVLVYHRANEARLQDCCLPDAGRRRHGSEPATAEALRRTVERLELRQTRRLIDPRERNDSRAAVPGLDVSSVIDLAIEHA